MQAKIHVYVIKTKKFRVIEKLNSNRGIMSYRGKDFSSKYVRPHVSKVNKYNEPSIVLVLGYEGVGILRFDYMGLGNYALSYENLYGNICKQINNKIVVDLNDGNRQITFVVPEGIELALEEINV